LPRNHVRDARKVGKKEVVERIFAGSQVEKVCNLYGPSETTTYSTWLSMAREDGFTPSIGRPIANTQIYILDSRGQLVPMGVIGEIFVGGSGVARGYLNRPELTAERFVHDPFSTDPQARMYKTGDLARWRPDGTLEYLGRNDHQVKIRGFRIELGEIESQLVRQDQVKEAVVLAREDVPNEKRLVAYVVPRTDTGLDVEGLRNSLKAVVPEYMVPAAFVVLNHLPLTPNGKLDRRALPAPEMGAYVSRQYEAPRGEVEEILAGIWQELLHVERVGRQDNFFELGGHSLLIVQMMERLRRVELSVEVRRVFEAPTLSDLASTVAHQLMQQSQVPPNLIPAGCDLITPSMLPLVALEAQHIEQIVRSVPGGAANVQDIYPLAPLQEGMLFHHRIDRAGGDTYVVPTLLTVSSEERLADLIAAVQAVVDRHDILRTAILWERLPQPVQVVHRKVSLPIEEIVLDPDREPLEQLKSRMAPEHQKLDLRKAPPIRMKIATDPRSSRRFALLQLHHITCDHVTLEALISQIVALLNNLQLGAPPTTPYRDHVAQAIAYAQRNASEAFFHEKLSDVEATTAPFGVVDVRGDGSRIQEGHLALESELAQRIRRRCRHLSISAASLFHAAWGLVVAVTSARDDVVFGSVLLGRLQGTAGAQNALGMFINTLPLRLRLTGVSTRQFVEQTQRELIELLNHEQASLAVVQRCSGIQSTAPLFTSLLNYRHSAPNLAAEWNSAAGIEQVACQERTNYPISVSVDDLGDGFTVTAQVDRNIDAHRVADYLCIAVRSIVESLEKEPHRPVLSLSILPDMEWNSVVRGFNHTEAPYPHEKLIHELIEEHARCSPDASAVEYGTEQLTYRVLNQRANQFARALLDEGVRPDDRVAVYLERSAEMVAVWLGILKVGGAYVPLDGSYPQDRVSFMLRDSAPVVIVTEQRLSSKLPTLGIPVLSIDTVGALSRPRLDNSRPSDLGIHPRNLAYVIYTSGSTGTPKGVGVEHRSVVNLVHWHCREFGISPASRCSSVAAVGFDASAWEIWSTLSAGATLLLPPSEIAGNTDKVLDWWARQRLDVSFLPTPLAEFAFGRDIVNPHLRTLLVGGDRLRARPVCNSFTLYNNYGPTEATVLATSGRIDSDDPVIHIGRPMANSTIYILDPNGNPTPIGIPGEIHIGGVGVARGYLERPDITAERFVPDPFNVSPGARMYRTGDIARWHANGVIEYQGRNDHQVKIRGFRIELGEIESALTQHSRVADAVVCVREDSPQDLRLVAYVVPVAGPRPGVEELRDHLKSTLPEYMVPSAFVMLERFPLTANGKIDQRALPEPESSAYGNRSFEPPQGDTEEILAAIWSDLLHVERIGRQDNFFELGGHSLHGMTLIARVSEQLDVELSVIAIFQYQTLQEMAEAITALLPIPAVWSNREDLQKIVF